MVKCPECGKEADDNPFCASCGTKIKQENLCPQCNEEIDEESVFCPKCGTKIKDDSIDDEIVEDEEESKKEEETTEEVNETEQEKVDEAKETESDKDTSDVEKQHCPFCDTEIDDETVFCPECGKSVEIDKQSLSGIKYSINLKNLIVCSIISILLSIFISLVFCYVFKSIKGDYYVVAFLIGLIISVGIFGSYKEIINGGLLGIITGLVLGLLSNFIVEFANGFTFSYEMLFGYPAVIFTILGLIIGIISTVYLRNSIKNTIDVENIL